VDRSIRADLNERDEQSRARMRARRCTRVAKSRSLVDATRACAIAEGDGALTG